MTILLLIFLLQYFVTDYLYRHAGIPINYNKDATHVRILYTVKMRISLFVSSMIPLMCLPWLMYLFTEYDNIKIIHTNKNLIKILEYLNKQVD